MIDPIDNIIHPEPASLNGKVPFTTDLSYAKAGDPLLKRMVIRTVEHLSGKRRIQRLYDEIHVEHPSPAEVWGRALEKLRIGIDFDPGQLAKIPERGPLIVIANHPYGVVDGLIMCHLLTRRRTDFFLLVNEVLADQPLLRGHLLPIDFNETREALQTNMLTKRLTTDRLNAGEALAIFPSGGVATAPSVWGRAEELPWRTFISRRIHTTQCTVVPMYFHGQNSRMFQLVSKLSMNLRLGLLLHELSNKIGRDFRVEIGDPLSYDEMAGYRKANDLIQFLKTTTESLER